jgi:hypothetical protein
MVQHVVIGKRCNPVEQINMNDPNQLAASIARKAQLLELLRKLAEAQLTLVNAGNMSRLMQVLGSKDSLLQQLQIVERQLDPFRDQDPEQRRWSSPEARLACQHDAARCTDLLAAIVMLEKQAEVEMTRRRDETAAQLQATYSSREAQGAYFAPAASTTSSLDLSMEG